MELTIYNTATRKKEIFKPQEPGKVKMYVCGPTVYDFLHIGNFRGAIFFNLVRNWLEHLGHEVTYVYNYTDVDDKIIQKANKEGVPPGELSHRFILEFEKDFQRLGLKPHSHNPRVTEFIEPIIEMIQKLIEDDKAYVVDGEVIYAVKNFEGYGKLSGKQLEDLQSGIRVEISTKKKNPLDFTLWKPSKPGEPFWESPWGAGRPGWHIECSAMASKLLGETIDIHGGGIDLIFPHHENEIAQSEGCFHKTFVNYWMHNNFINMGAQKMSKSLGNVFTARAFLEKFHPEILKYMMLSAHYRSFSDFSEPQIHNTIAGLARIYSAMALADHVLKTSTLASSEKDAQGFVDLLKRLDQEVADSLNDDFNTPEVFARIFEAVRMYNAKVKRGAKVTAETHQMSLLLNPWIQKIGKWLSLLEQAPQDFLIELDDLLLNHKGLERKAIDLKVAERSQARLSKDWAKSDLLRNELNQMGIAVSDAPEGSMWEVQK